MNEIRNKKNKLILIGLAILLAILALALFRRSSLFQYINVPFEYYLKLILGVVKSILQLFGQHYELSGLQLISENTAISFETGNLLKRWLLAIPALIWITPTLYQKKIKFTLLFLFIHFITISVFLTVRSFLINIGDNDSITVSRVIALIVFWTFTTFWIKRNPELLGLVAKFTKTNLEYILKKYNVLSNIIYTLILVNLILGYFDFLPWITLLFTITQYIVEAFDYTAIVEPFYLLGENANIYMAKGCLGILTSFIFGAFVYLTGEAVKPKVKFIITGVVLINIVNILRFVFLFMHLQNNGEYLWNMEVHDMFNVLIYSFVFLLWVIWLERFSDIWPHLKKASES